jgi:hypothetical protein
MISLANRCDGVADPGSWSGLVHDELVAMPLGVAETRGDHM